MSSCPSSIHLDVGQSVSCTASVSGGTSPYTYNWLISNSITNAITANMLFTGVTSTSNTFTYTTVSADTSNSPEQFNVIVTDSNPTTVNSIYSSTFTTNPALGTPTLSSSPTLPSTQTVGNTITFTASWTGGTSSYTANYLITNTVTGNLVANMLFTGITGTSNSFAWTIPSADAGNTLRANVIIIDSASTPETVNSPYGSTITVVSNSQPSQQGNIMYLVNGAGTSNIVIINLATNTVTGSITSGINNPGGLSISPSGTYAYLTNYYGENAVIINIATNTVTGAITSGFSSPQGVSFSPSGTYAYVTNFDSNNVVIINTATNTVTGSITTGLNTPYGVSISPSGTYAYVTNYAENSISIINTASNTVTGSITAGIAYPEAVAISPSGTYAYVYNQKNNNVVIINTASNTVTGAITSGFAYSTGIAFSPSTKYAYVTNFDSNNVVIINTVTNTVTGSITEGSKESVSIAFVPASVPLCATPDSSPLSVPTNIIAYAPINICNFQSDSTIAPFQQELNINSSKYMAFEANNLDNIEFFYSNGTTITSWLEGNNMLSGEQFGVSSSSKSTVYWLNITKGMPADSNLSIFMGFAAASTNLMNGNSIGEEPGLSGIYAQYDNGNKIFDFYMNANSIPSVEDPNSISIYQAGAVGSSPQLSVTSNPTTGKAISVTPSSTGEDTYYFMNAPHIPTQFIETAWYYTTGNAFDAWIGALNGGSLNGYSAMTGDSFNSQLSIYLDSARSLMQQVPYVYPYNEWLSEGMAYQDGNITAYSGNGLSLLQFGTNLTATNALYSSFNTVFFAPYIGTSAYTRLLGLISVRAAPPNGIMPQTAYGNLSAIMQQSNITVSNTIIDVGQSSTLSATISGGNGAIGGEWALVASNNLNNNVVNTINFPSGGSGLAVSPTGSFAYVTIGPNAGTVDVLNLISNSIAGSFSVGDTPEEVAINPAGTIAYVPNYGSRTISVVSTASNSVVTTIDTSFYPTAVNFNPQGNLAYVDSPASRVYIVDVSSNTIVNSINVGNYPDGTVFSKNGAYAYIADLNSGSISIINVSENRTVNTILISPSAFTTDVAVNPDGTLLYATNENGNNVSVISTATNTVVNTINVGNGPWSIYLNPTGSLAYVINAYDNKVSVINTATNTVIDNVSAPTIGSLGAFSPITNIFYALGYSELSGISIPQTNNQPLPGSGYSHTMQLTVNAFSSNALLLTFNGVRYIESSGSNDIFGNYGISAYVNDSTSPIYQTIIMSNTLKVNPALDGKLFTASNSYIDNTQYQTLTAEVSGGTPPYTYNFIVYNTTGIQVYNALYSSVSQTSNTFTYLQSGAGGTYTANIIVTDSATNSEASSNTLIYQNEPSMVAGSITPSSPSIDAGQQILLNSHVSGGTPPYKFTWYTSNSVNPACQISDIISGATGSSISVSPSTSNTYDYEVEDNAITSVSACSSGDAITVNPVLGSATLTVSNSVIDAGQTMTLTGSITGGTPPYSYAYSIYNASGIRVYSKTYTSASTSNSLNLQQTNSWGSGAFTANLLVTDNDLYTSGTSNSYVANPALSAVSFTASNAIAAPPQYQTLTYSISGGTGPYSYNFLVYNSIGILMDNIVNSASNTFAFQLTTTSLWHSGVYTANAVAVDSATSNELVYSSLHFLVCPGVTFTGALSNSIIDYGQFQTVSVNVIGCQGPYTYNYMVYNPSGSLVYNSLFQTAQTYNTITLNGNKIGQWIVNVIVTDSESTPVSYSESLTYNVIPQPSVSLTPTSNTLDSSQAIILSAVPYNGIPPYSYKWYTSSSGSASCTNSDLIPGIVTQTYNALPSSTSNYAVQVTDSAPTPDSACSSSSSILVNPVLSVSYISPSNPEYDIGAGGNIILTGSWTGGTSTYTSNWSIYHYTDRVYNALYQGINTNTNSISLPVRLLGIGTFDANLSILDSASTPSKAKSSNDNIVIIHNPTVSLTPNATSIVNGREVKFTATISGGTGPFNVLLVAGNGIVIDTISGVSIGNTLMGPIMPPLGNNTYNVLVTDEGAYIPYTFNSTSITINVRNQLANSINQQTGSCTGICVHGSGGTPPTGAPNITTYTTTLSSSTTLSTTTETTIPLTTSIVPRAPIQVSITPNGSSTSQLCESFNEEYSINYTSLGAVFVINPGSSGCFKITALNATSLSINASNNFGRMLRSINFTINNPNISTTAVLSYQCNVPAQDVAPFILINGSWSMIMPFTANDSACTVSFKVPQDPIIALFYNANATILTTPTTLLSTIAPTVHQSQNPLLIVMAIVVILIVMLVMYIYLKRRRPSGRKRF